MTNDRSSKTATTIATVYYILATITIIAGGTISLLTNIPETFPSLSSIEVYRNFIIAILALMGWVSALFLILLHARKRKKHIDVLAQKVELDDKIGRLVSNQIAFQNLSKYAADFEKETFGIVLEALRDNPLSRDAYNSLYDKIKVNNEIILNFACDIFNELSGHPCAGCIKVVRADSIPTTKNWASLGIETLLRDMRSRPNRSKHDSNDEDFVSDNTPDRHLFQSTHGEFRTIVWASDDLEAEEKAGRYRNKRSNYLDDYNATVVAGIPDLTGELPWIGMFCIDNKGGGLASETSKSYATEFAWLCAVLLYKEKLIEQFDKNNL